MVIFIYAIFCNVMIYGVLENVIFLYIHIYGMKISYKLQVTSVAAVFTTVLSKLRITNTELRIIVGVTFTVTRFYGISTFYFHRWLVAETPQCKDSIINNILEE